MKECYLSGQLHGWQFQAESARYFSGRSPSKPQQVALAVEHNIMAWPRGSCFQHELAYLKSPSIASAFCHFLQTSIVVWFRQSRHAHTMCGLVQVGCALTPGSGLQSAWLRGQSQVSSSACWSCPCPRVCSACWRYEVCRHGR